MSTLLRSLWREPRAPDAPEPGAQDWALVALIVLCALLELALRKDLTWPLLSFVLTAGFATVLPWRRSEPAITTAAVFTVNSAVKTYSLLLGVDWGGLYSMVLVLILPYALARWGSGREVTLTALLLFANFAVNLFIERPPLGEMIGAGVFLLLPLTIGASVRYRDAEQRRASAAVRLREREQLARELHDTVGHYLAAIAVQAQAGLALAAKDPQAPVTALRIIEDAASSTLQEMRSLLRAMLYDDEAAFTPAKSIEDIERLARNESYPFSVELTLEGALTDVDATLASTLYRLTQEALTNTVKHARGAKVVSITIEGTAAEIRLQVVDDGEAVARLPGAGLGLQGMQERVKLLGGSLTAGPGKARGWAVDAVLPRTRTAA